MAEQEPHFVVATFWEQLRPYDRDDRYEEPLIDVLEAEDLGEFFGGGSQFSKQGEMVSVYVEFELNDLERGLAVAIATLEKQGAPKGSELSYTENEIKKTLTFGVTECLAIFLDGVNLPDAVYENTDINDLADLIDERLIADSLGELHGSWGGAEETAIFLYGNNAEDMYVALQPILETYPLCQNSRIVIRHGKAGDDPRTIRVPWKG